MRLIQHSLLCRVWRERTAERNREQLRFGGLVQRIVTKSLCSNRTCTRFSRARVARSAAGPRLLEPPTGNAAVSLGPGG